MNETFNVVIARAAENGTTVTLEKMSVADLPEYDVQIEIAYSSLNYKDALAVTASAPICRRLPMVCGIDLAGKVVESNSADWQVGDRVLVNGFGLSETEWGGYTQRQAVKPEWLVRTPDAISEQQAMAIGTAGYTAMLSVLALQDHGVTPVSGPVLVTGASGGVGSVAIMLLAKLGYEVTAVSGRESMHDYLRQLGASALLPRDALSARSRPLEKEQWAAAIDSVGGQTLATVLAQTKRDGIVAACGLAGGSDLPATVMPFILRGVTLRGIDSVMASQAHRQRAWKALASTLDFDQLKLATSVKPMSEIHSLAADLLAGQLRGRVVIDVNA
ncbi:alcohol dehydrogenase [Arenicella chitinivorans]|uniref:Alcohol dehydrogenase n=1 Tax=Arenicella chitinivorans TaxID=1329800 RepID=A0A918RMV3_9GAMM|nr:MDR family oxidoreductase [Arenicella chitinivorans]GHA01276.1 alcohol dehydrogenase [Arenicella chitinivorans]